MRRNGKYLFTSESVGEGHPDKVADQISDSVLDAIFCNDPKARVDCETLVMQGTVMITGQITTMCYVNIPSIVRNTLKEIGLDNAKDGLDWETCGILVSLTEQSPDISMGVTETNGTRTRRRRPRHGFRLRNQRNQRTHAPANHALPTRLVKRLADCDTKASCPILRPDCKSQVTVEYENGKPQCVNSSRYRRTKQRQSRRRRLKRRNHRKSHQKRHPSKHASRRHKIRHQRHRQIRHRRNTRRLRLNRQKNHR